MGGDENGRPRPRPRPRHRAAVDGPGRAVVGLPDVALFQFGAERLILRARL